MATSLGSGASFSPEVKHATVVFGDTTATEIFQLPPNSRVIALYVDVTTAFAGGTGLLDIGKAGDADYFADDVDVSSTGRATVSLLTGGVDLGAQPVSIVAQAVGSDTSGSCTVMVLYFTTSHSHLH
jgi:hypothetical protein